MKRWGTRLHAAIYRVTHGRALGRVDGQPVLLLQTAGRRTGQRRTTPVQYLADGDTSSSWPPTPAPHARRPGT